MLFTVFTLELIIDFAVISFLSFFLVRDKSSVVCCLFSWTVLKAGALMTASGFF